MQTLPLLVSAGIVVTLDAQKFCLLLANETPWNVVRQTTFRLAVPSRPFVAYHLSPLSNE
jgi:hypothetical protein